MKRLNEIADIFWQKIQPLKLRIIGLGNYAPLIVIVIHVVLYFTNHPSIRLRDEAAYIDIARQMWQFGIPESTHTFYDRYLTIFSLAGLTNVLGYSRYFLRLGNLILLLLSTPLIFHLLKKIGLRNPVSVLFFFSFHPAMFSLIKDCKPDFYFAVVSSIAFLYLIYFVKSKRRIIYFLFLASMFISFLVKETVLITATSALIVLFFYRKRLVDKYFFLQSTIAIGIFYALYTILAEQFDTNLIERIQHTKTGIRHAMEIKILSDANFFENRFGKRLFNFLLGNREMQFLILGTFPAIRILWVDRKSILLMVSSIFLLLSILYLTAGSLSIISYVPLKLSSRFWLFILMPFTILWIDFIARKKKQAIWAIVLFILSHLAINRYLHGYVAIGTAFISLWICLPRKLTPSSFSLVTLLLSIYLVLCTSKRRNGEADFLKASASHFGIDTMYVDQKLKRWSYIFFEGNEPDFELRVWQHSEKSGHYWICKKRLYFQFQDSGQQQDTLYDDGRNLLICY